MSIERINDYEIEYYEVKSKDIFISSYITIIEVYKYGELVLSSRDKTEEEFLNYLSFLVFDDDVLNFIKNKEYNYDYDVEDYEYCGDLICDNVDDIYID